MSPVQQEPVNTTEHTSKRPLCKLKYSRSAVGMWSKVDHYALSKGWPGEHKNLPEVTLSAYDETGRAESVPVLKQRFYTGRILPSSVANTTCADLDVNGMMKVLNINAPVRRTLYKGCEYFIADNCDIGTAYAHLHPHLYDFDTDGHVVEAQRKDEEMRQDMLFNKKIIDGDAPPRRVWDLHANRIVPWWVARKYPWAISHAWVDDKDLKRQMTPINGYQWPVPMPKDADLNLIRIEMLNLGAEYVWLDVLCLRQKGQGEVPRGNPSQEEWDRREALRREEWKVDLPTIGWVYHKAEKVIYYFSGLGLPLSFRYGDFESERCWFNRAWTLQEMSHNFLIAGETRHDYFGQKGELMRIWNLLDRASTQQEMAAGLFIPEKICRFMTKSMRKKFIKKLASLRQMSRRGFDSAFDVLSEMQKRTSTNPVDKVAGLVYLLYSQYIPIYDADQSEEDAWTELVSAMQDWFRADLFFLYPGPGSGNKSWHPSWMQVTTETFPKSSLSKDLYTVKVYRTDGDEDGYYGLCIDSCRVRGLADASSPDILRRGKLDVNVDSTIEHTFDIVADHGFPIPDGMYTLIGTAKHSSTMEGVIWVVGKTEGPGEKFMKMSLFRMANKQEEERLWNIEAHSQTETFLR